MRRRPVFVGLLLACAVTPLCAAADARPHVLFISIDDLNDWLGCLNGHPQALTPHIDQLASRGILFTNAHCVAPACRPSRAALFTGLKPARTNVWSNNSQPLLKQHSDVVTIPQVFQQGGYATRGTGKLIHQNSAGAILFGEYFKPEQRWSPLTRESVRYTEEERPSKASENPRHTIVRRGQQPVVLPLNRMPSDRKPQSPAGESFDWGPFDVPDSAMGDAQITDWAIDQLNEPRSQPLFLGVGYYRPHIPLWAPRSYFERFKGVEIQLPPHRDRDLDDLSDLGKQWAIEPVTAGRHATVLHHGQWQAAVQAYLACVTFVDHHVGRLITALDSGPHKDNTLIVLWSDHGWHLGEKQHWGKWTGWERSTRVPLIVIPPTSQAAEYAIGQRCDQPVSLIDLFPTLTEFCGLTTPDQLDGESLVPLLQMPDVESGRAVVTYFDRHNLAVRTHRWRYIRYADGSEELYDHDADPHEWTNLAHQKTHRPVLEEMRQTSP